MDISKRELYLFYVREGWSAREIGVLFSLSQWKVYRLLEEHGIPRRRPGGAFANAPSRDKLLKIHKDRRCRAIRLDGKRCRNWKVCGRMYCRLHLEELR